MNIGSRGRLFMASEYADRIDALRSLAERLDEISESILRDPRNYVPQEAAVIAGFADVHADLARKLLAGLEKAQRGIYE